MTTLNILLEGHRRNELWKERHAASLEVRHNTGPNAEVEVVNSQLEANEDAFVTDAQIIDEHDDEECLDHPCVECSSSAIDAAMNGAKLQYFADYDDPNADPQELQQRCRELKIDGKDWEGYYARRAEKAKQF